MGSKLFRLLSLVVLVSVFAEAQDTPTYTTNYSFKKWTEGSYPSADSVSDNWNDLDSLLNVASPTGKELAYTAPFVDATGAAWLVGDGYVHFYPFTIAAGMTPDSVFFHIRSGGAATDTFYVAINSFDGATRYCHSGALVGPSASPGWVRAAFSTTAYLKPGTYLVAFGSPNAVSSAPIPTVGLLNGATEWNLDARLEDVGGTRRMGTIVAGLTSGVIQSNLQTSAVTYAATGMPVFLILGQ